MSAPASYINKRVSRKSCEKYYKLQTPSLIHILVDFIQIHTPCDASEKYLTNPHKNLLYAISGVSNVTRRGFIEIINEVENGPLANIWKDVISKASNKQEEEYDVFASFDSRHVPVEIGNITLPDVSLDIQEEIRNLKGTVKEINQSLEQSMRNHSMKNQNMTSTTRRPLTRQKNLDELSHNPVKDRSFLDESLDPKGPDFKNVLSSTVDEDLASAINIFWRVRDGNVEKLQKVIVPKIPPKDKYPIRHHFLVPEPVQRPKMKGVINHEKLQAMIDELGVYKSSYDRKIKDHKWPKKSKTRYPMIGIKY